jgi:Zn-dependent peptidase ImmA (M78 family)/transcriptional regulator with XRE-family HTH domain
MAKRELAEALNVSPASVTQYEAGRMVPRPPVVGRMALILGCPVGYFYDGPDRRVALASSGSFFRSLRATRQWERDQGEAHAEHIWDLLTLLERELELPVVHLPDCGGVTPDAPRGAIEAVAERVRQGWEMPPGPVGNVVRLLEAHGILVSRLPGGSNRMDAFSRWLGDRPVILLWAHKGDSARSRFDAAHELGHLAMHGEPEPANQILERQAHAFAAAFLMPAEQVEGELPRRAPRENDWDALFGLRRRWGVSIASLFYRGRELGTLSEAGFRRAMVRLSARGLRRGEGDEETPEQPCLLEQAIQALLAHRAWRLEDVAHELRFSERQLRSVLGDTAPSTVPAAQAPVVPLNARRLRPTRSPIA